MNRTTQTTLFTVFALSGFCSLLYQIVWIRLAYAHFGITTPVLSVVISVFMLGYALGAWGGGRFIDLWTRKTGFAPNIFYAIAEICIGCGAFIVPLIFSGDERLLLSLGESNSLFYLVCSGLLITVSILPLCFLMGTTFPFIMDYLKKTQDRSSQSFSFLYFANVLGAVLSTMLTTIVFIESYGFTHTLWIAGGLNFIIAGLSLSLPGLPADRDVSSTLPQEAITAGDGRVGYTTVILFVTGFSSLAMEVVWTRAFTPVLGTQVYAFSLLLSGILFATWLGSYLYRRSLARCGTGLVKEKLLALAAIFSFFPIVFNDPRISVHLSQQEIVVLIFLSITPLMTVLGYLTPSLIDRGSRGDPKKAGKSYSINILGCIIGPLIASYALLPHFGAANSLVLLALPFMGLLFLHGRSSSGIWRWGGLSASVILLLVSVLYSSSYEVPQFNSYILKRDYAATVVAATGDGSTKYLLVNGQNMTVANSVTKIMAHLPLVLHQQRPEKGLIICFGMGTTFRSMLSWHIDTTVVELVPGVRDVFSYFFGDADSFITNPQGHIVIDDGRRFLMRTKETFDVITIDPPPPIEAAGSSLLYSKEFYELVKMRLKPGGIFQQWFPETSGPYALDTLSAVSQSLCDSFQYVRGYVGFGGWGIHFIASQTPIVVPSTEVMTARMPESARRDLEEWFSLKDPGATWYSVVSKEVPVSILLPRDPSFCITDDRPYNEYYLVRKMVMFLGKKPAPKSLFPHALNTNNQSTS